MSNVSDNNIYNLCLDVTDMALVYDVFANVF